MTGASTSRQDLPVGANPFSRRAVLAIVLIGGALLLALLWMVGTGAGMGSINDGQAQVGSKGLTGYAAMADYLERRGYALRRVRNEGALNAPGLLVLTPPPFADGKAIEKIVAAHRHTGPTLVIGPKWVESRPQADEKAVKTGWVRLSGTQAPTWKNFLDEVTVAIGPISRGQTANWRGMGISGSLPDRRAVLSGRGGDLVPLIVASDGRVLAAFLDDGGSYPGLEKLGASPPTLEVQDERLQPLIIVFEPDLLNNYGMARPQSAELAERLVRAAGVSPGGPVLFDLTLNGLGQSANLLTLAFTPPFLAATLCLLLAAVVTGWRAFLRFGPPFMPDRAIAFGKLALVANAAGLMRRSGRLHLLANPYADRARERLAQALALPSALDVEAAGHAIDRALASRRPDAEPFTALVERLKAARGPHDLLKAARDLHALERMLIR